MSIPPLVCSTPPPPDQCEDFKENDEFDINYGMAQEDDERNDYFCTFSVANTPIKNRQNIPLDTVNSESKSDTVVAQIFTHENEIANSVKMKDGLHIENIIEDLDLHFEQATISTAKENSENVKKTESDKDSCIAELSPAHSENNTTESSPSCSSGIGMSFIENINTESSDPEKPKSDNFLDEECITNDNETVTIISSQLNNIETIPMCDPQDFDNVFQNVAVDVKNDTDEIITTTLIKEVVIDNSIINNSVINNDDDFGDFDNFQFIAQDLNTDTTNIEVTDSPWGNNDNSESLKISSDFHANFDDFENKVKTNNMESIHEQHSCTDHNLDDGDDDFGDFNDFKTSSNTETQINTDTSICTDDPALNKRDASYMEKVEKILDSIFGEETTSCNEKFDKVLDSLLCETWGHLLQIEDRLPYMVTWNNSVGQKTLLKSLCIDSRNILFAPKWGNSTMPRYAVNLGGAPLQPLKQTTTSSTSYSDAGNEKHPRDTWQDPFTNTGQDGSNNVNGEEIKESKVPKPNDLTQDKADRVYPASLTIQPLRQINLPDTHIYTPTDSETPRSQTIHYDNQPNTHDTSKLQDESYAEFQDFKSTVESTPSSSNDCSDSKTISKVLHHAILQPVKVMSTPTLNWPDPGCVKETFDDFSDFVTNSSWFTSKSETEPNEPTDFTNNVKEIPDPAIPEITSRLQNKVNGLEDDFDSFQSATPVQQISKPHSNISHSKTLDDNSFKCTFPEINHKQDNVTSLPNIPVKLKEPELSLNKHTNIETLKIAENHYRVISDSFNPPLLQPTPAPSTPKHNSTQILQPLSLESISQINWPNPGIDLQDLSRFNPVDKVHSLKNEASTGVISKSGSPVHVSANQVDDDWGDFVSSRPKQSVPVSKPPPSNDDDEWSDFVSSPAVRPQNGLSTISLNVHTFSSIQKSMGHTRQKLDGKPADIPSLNYITPKTGFRGHNTHNPHFQNL